MSHDVECTGQYFQMIYFLVSAYPPKLLDVATTCTNFTGAYIGHMMWRVLVKGQLMYFLVNASPKTLEVAASNFAGA